MTSFESDGLKTKHETWIRFAAKDLITGELGEVHTHEQYLRALGHSGIVQVQVSEYPEGTHYGWIKHGESAPELIQPHRGAYLIQFPYDPKDEERAGRGHTVRLSVQELSSTE